MASRKADNVLELPADGIGHRPVVGQRDDRLSEPFFREECRERLLRFLTVSLDKHAVAYNEKKRAKKAEAAATAEAPAEA